jgi:hypothetical protein
LDNELFVDGPRFPFSSFKNPRRLPPSGFRWTIHIPSIAPPNFTTCWIIPSIQGTRRIIPAFQGTRRINTVIQGTGRINPVFQETGRFNSVIQGTGRINPVFQETGQFNPVIQGAVDVSRSNTGFIIILGFILQQTMGIIPTMGQGYLRTFTGLRTWSWLFPH